MLLRLVYPTSLHSPRFAFSSSRQPAPFTNLPRFDRLGRTHIEAHTSFSARLQLNSQFRWTPLIQVSQDPHSPALRDQMMAYHKQSVFGPEHEAQLTDLLLQEALHGSSFDFYYDYQCQPSPGCQFHGRLDYLIYRKDSEQGLPIVPVVRTQKKKEPLTEQMADYWNVYQCLGAAIWALSNSRATDPSIKSQLVLHTNGNEWRLYQVNLDGQFRKTGFYQPNNQFKKIYRDKQAIDLVLGLIRYSTQHLSPQENYLKEVYSYIDDQRHLTKYSPQDIATQQNKLRFWWFLPRRVREFFFSS